MPFDVSKPFRARIGFDAEEKPIIGLLRYPPDESWRDRARKHPAVRTITAKNSIKPQDVDTKEFDAELVKSLWLEDSPRDDDEYLAAEIIGALDRSEVDTITRTGRSYTVTLVVYGKDDRQDDGRARTKHTLREPSKKEVTNFFRKSSDSEAQKRNIVTVNLLEPGAKLYDDLFESAENYALNESDKPAIPINHKNAVVLEVCLAASRRNAVDDIDPGI